MDKEDEKSRSNDLKNNVISWIENTLSSKGFHVRRNAVIEGDGIAHLFDIVAEASPLPGSKITIGVIVSEDNVNVEFIEKLIGWIDELHTVKIVVVPLKSVDPKAQMLAHKYGIDVISLPKEAFKHVREIVEGLNTYYVEPVSSLEIVIKKIRDKTKRSLFRSTKCIVNKIALVYYPLIEYKVELPRVSVETGEAEVVEGKLVFEGLNGYLIVGNGEFLKILHEYGSFVDIPDEAHSVLKILSEERAVELGVLSARTRLDQYMLKSLLNELSMHGFIDIYGDLVEFKNMNTRIFMDLDEWIKKHKALIKPGEPEENECIVKINVKIPLYKLDDLITCLGARIVNSKITYYPLYAALVSEVRGELRRDKIVAFDGVSSNEIEDFSLHLTTPEVIDKIKKIKGFEYKFENEH